MEENGVKLYSISERLPLKCVSASPVLFDYACDNHINSYEGGKYMIDHLTYADYDAKTYPDYITFPVVFRIFDGSKLSDIISMRYTGMSALISDHVVEVLRQNNLTGWSTYPIVLLDKKGNAIGGYHGFTVTGRAGGVIELVPENEIVFEQRYKYQQWELSSWDGSDFAHIKGRYETICTERVRIAIKNAGIKGLRFDPFDQEVTII